MNVQELRLCNYVMQSGKITEVESIKSGLNDLARINGLIYKSCTPITLTEDWLLKFGFIECEGKYGIYFKCSKFEGFRIWFFENEHQETWSVGRKDYDNDNTDFIHGGIKHVHQLQNLYFALTGTELFFNE